MDLTPNLMSQWLPQILFVFALVDCRGATFTDADKRKLSLKFTPWRWGWFLVLAHWLGLKNITPDGTFNQSRDICVCECMCHHYNSLQTANLLLFSCNFQSHPTVSLLWKGGGEGTLRSCWAAYWCLLKKMMLMAQLSKTFQLYMGSLLSMVFVIVSRLFPDLNRRFLLFGI